MIGYKLPAVKMLGWLWQRVFFCCYLSVGGDNRRMLNSQPQYSWL